MSVESNRQLAYDLMKAFSIDAHGDIEPYMAFFTDDAIFEPMVNSDLFPEMKGPWTKAQRREYLLAELEVFSIKYTVTGVTADENRIAIEATCTVQIGEHCYENRYHFLAEVRGGQISKLRLYLDTLYAKHAVGWIAEFLAQQSNLRRLFADGAGDRPGGH